MVDLLCTFTAFVYVAMIFFVFWKLRGLEALRKYSAIKYQIAFGVAAILWPFFLLVVEVSRDKEGGIIA